ncbi:MAG: hypothetical protein ACRD68_11320, partial [Pyrinomonadaceae bacterium]
MSQNRDYNSPSTGGAGTGATDAGTTRDSSTGMTYGSGGAGTSSGYSGGSSSGSGAGTATGLAQQYGQKVADAATQARDYVTEKAGVVGDKFKELQNKDFSQVAEEAKEYARQKPGQALLISAAAGFVIGLLL